MNKLLLLAVSLVTWASFANAQLTISGVIHANLSGGKPNAIRLCATQDIPDLSIYTVQSKKNQGGIAINGPSFVFPAEALNVGDCVWIALEEQAFTDFFGYAPCYVDDVANVNGKNAILLMENSNMIDVYGDLGGKGNKSDWEYKNGWSFKTVNTSNTTFNVADWQISGVDALSGATSNATASTPFPGTFQICATSTPALPVELASFTAQQKEDKIELHWSTASELNNDYFELEHSTNGIDFKSITHIDGMGTSSIMQHYNFTHELPARKNYYRLRQVDFDGAFEYSDVVFIEATKLVDAIAVHPTAATSQIKIHLLKELDEPAVFSIFSFTGKEMFSSTINETTTIDISDYQGGQYNVRVKSGEVIFNQRFFKVKL